VIIIVIRSDITIRCTPIGASIVRSLAPLIDDLERMSCSSVTLPCLYLSRVMIGVRRGCVVRVGIGVNTHDGLRCHR
jgi:hypothetical protein